jgi:integrase
MRAGQSSQTIHAGLALWNWDKRLISPRLTSSRLAGSACRRRCAAITRAATPLRRSVRTSVLGLNAHRALNDGSAADRARDMTMPPDFEGLAKLRAKKIDPEVRDNEGVDELAEGGEEAKDGARASTLGRRVAAIRYAHKASGHEPPTNRETVKAVKRGIRRIGAAPEQKDAATAGRIVAMVALIPDTLAGKRDRALLLLGFAGAFRRSKLVALTVADLIEAPGGMRVAIRKSKTDQEGAGQDRHTRRR